MLGIKLLGAITTHSNQVFDGSSLELLVTIPPALHCEVCVIVPVRDEAENLADTLLALAQQVDLEGRQFDRERYEIILLINNSCDDSAAIARCFAKQHSALALHVVEITLPASEAYVGRVRRILMDEAYRRMTSLGHRHGAIASTDGDTRVAPTWLAATLQELRGGADAVGGRILTDRSDRLALDCYTRLCHLREVGYQYLLAELETYLDPDPYDRWPKHYQHYGASLAVTAQMYGRVGGIPAVRSPEDVAFYQALRRVDARFRHSPEVRVVTSARQVGRAKNGLANQLSEWTVMGRKHQPFLVTSPAAVEARLQARRELRMLWQRKQVEYQLSETDVARSADKLGVPTQWLAQELQQLQPFGLLHFRTTAKHEETSAPPLVEIGQAICELRIRLNRIRCAANYLLDPLEKVKPVLFLAPTTQMPQIRTAPQKK